MAATDALLFIDANRYLDLYRTKKGNRLLAPLQEQVDHIFVTQQVVDEVQRQKLSAAAQLWVDEMPELQLKTFDLPDHLFGTSPSAREDAFRRMHEIGEQIDRLNQNIAALGRDIVDKISRSDDEVSKALAPIFHKAVVHSAEELQRAQDRRARGNPPGKTKQAVGDQLTWEQILSEFCLRQKKRLWIISRDSDFGTIYKGTGFLNAFLYEELRRVNPNCEVFLFDEIREGIKHFASKTGVSAKQLPPEEVAKEIRREEDKLPPLGWLVMDEVSPSIVNLWNREFWNRAASEQMARAAAGLIKNTED